MSEPKPPEAAPEPAPPAAETPSRYADLDLLQQEVEKRIRDNQRFLERFLDEDYPDEADETEDGADDEEFEEL